MVNTSADDDDSDDNVEKSVSDNPIAQALM